MCNGKKTILESIPLSEMRREIFDIDQFSTEWIIQIAKSKEGQPTFCPVGLEINLPRLGQNFSGHVFVYVSAMFRTNTGPFSKLKPFKNAKQHIVAAHVQNDGAAASVALIFRSSRKKWFVIFFDLDPLD